MREFRGRLGQLPLHTLSLDGLVAQLGQESGDILDLLLTPLVPHLTAGLELDADAALQAFAAS